MISFTDGANHMTSFIIGLGFVVSIGSIAYYVYHEFTEGRFASRRPMSNGQAAEIAKRNSRQRIAAKTGDKKPAMFGSR
jgi:uncharacterized membrane protein YebE (DUF533 family)